MSFFFFLNGSFLKALLNLLQYCFCFIFWFFGCETCGILALQLGIEPAPPALAGEVLTAREILSHELFIHPSPLQLVSCLPHSLLQVTSLF